MLSVDKELFQWEKDRYVNIMTTNPIITVVEFSNKKAEESISVLVTNNKAKIPNQLLQESIPIFALACTGQPGTTKVVGRKQFRVLKRKKPTDYTEDIPDAPDIPSEPGSGTDCNCPEIATNEEIFQMLVEMDVVPSVIDFDGAFLSDEQGNILLW